MVKGVPVPPDSVVLTPAEAAGLSDRVYQVRCAAEDVSTAVAEGADADELRGLCDALLAAVRRPDGWRADRARRTAYSRHREPNRSRGPAFLPSVGQVSAKFFWFLPTNGDSRSIVGASHVRASHDPGRVSGAHSPLSGRDRPCRRPIGLRRSPHADRDVV